MEIIFLDSGTIDFGDVNFSSIKALGNLTLYEFTTSENVKERIEHAEIIIVNKFKINHEVLQMAPKLQYIVVAATGFNNMDVTALKKINMPVSNVRGYSTSSVVQHVFAALLTVINRPGHYFNEVKKGRWNSVPDFCFYDHSIEELNGKTIGIAGFGDIGKKIADVAMAFGMKVLVLAHDSLRAHDRYGIATKEVFFKNSDIVTLHLPLNDKTTEFIDQSSLQWMKKNAILVNTGRGGLINEKDLFLHALSNPEFRIILDVLSQEPPTEGKDLMGLDNCYITPHIAWASKEARQRLIEGIALNIKSKLSGEWVNRIF